MNHANADKIVALLRPIQDGYSRSKLSTMTSPSALQPSEGDALRINKLERELAEARSSSVQFYNDAMGNIRELEAEVKRLQAGELNRHECSGSEIAIENRVLFLINVAHYNYRERTSNDSFRKEPNRDLPNLIPVREIILPVFIS